MAAISLAVPDAIALTTEAAVFATAEPADFAAFGADFRHARASGQFDASIFDMAFFGGREREFAQFFERDHFDRFRTAFERRQRAVDRNCATAHDDDVA